MGSGCVHEVDVSHIEEREHHVQFWEYLQQELFLTPDCTAKTIKKLLSPEVAHLADSYGVETAKRGKALCLAITLGTTSAPVMIIIRKTPSCLKTLTAYPSPRCKPQHKIPACGNGQQFRSPYRNGPISAAAGI
jgi:hypothetical protein